MESYVDVTAASPRTSSDEQESIFPQKLHAKRYCSDDIAVVGMACRVAGGNDTPEKLWESLLNKRVASGQIPAMRWAPYYRRDPRNAKALKDTTQRGYFLDNLEQFDNTFFGISPKEAILMDPQQRIAVEVTWEALEDAGIPPQSLAGSNTAVFMGVNSDDYSKLLLEDIPGIEAWMGIGTAHCGVPNRISYLLDLMGPSTAVDAACASSLVAIHHGRQALQAGESDVAIVGGVNALCGPGLTRVLDRAGAISKDGVCRSFDNAARGYGRGEGASVIILKRLSDAICANDRVLAVLRGSAVAQDGRTNGIMAPNGLAQEMVARNTLRIANIDASTVQYVEAHATSTAVGDPIEIGAISRVYGANREPTAPCFIGSIKPNIGHLEAGAGAIGFMKAVLAINKGTIPPQANLENLNQKIDWKNSGIEVAQVPMNWPETNCVRRVAICSYGYGGTVSHAIIEAAPIVAPLSLDRSMDSKADEPTVLLLSGPQEKRIATAAQALGKWIAGNGAKKQLSSIAATLATRRGHHTCRAALVVSSHEEALEATEALAVGASHAGISSGRALAKEDQKGAVWVFSGHGAQWPAMGQELMANDQVFHDVIADMEPIIKTEMGFSALQALQDGDFDSSDKVQVLTYAMQVGLTAVLRAKGAQPKAIIGHSVGEIAASVASGALTASEGAIVVCRRARLYRQVIGRGAMVLINSPFEEAEKEIGTRNDICAAIHSSPTSCVVSGSVGAVEEFSKKWKARGIKVFQVQSNIAFHSPILDCLLKPLYGALADALAPRPAAIPMYSTATRDPRQLCPRDAKYWAQNMVNPVLLTSATRAAAQDGFRVFLEVSTHPIVTHSITETLMDMELDDYAVLPTLFRNKPARKSLLQGLVAMWCKGVPIKWERLFPGADWADDVPKTIWNHQAFWKDVEAGSMNTAARHDVESHTLLGQYVPVAGGSTTIFTTRLDDNTKPFPGSHPLYGTEIIPAAVLFNTFFHASGSRLLSDVDLLVPVAISAPRDIQVALQKHKISLISRLIQPKDDLSDNNDRDSWLTHTIGRFSSASTADASEYGSDVNIAATKARIRTELKPTFSIDYLADVGVSAMGFPWAVTEHFGNPREMLVRIDVSPATANGAALPWDAASWAPVFDAATSVSSTLFYETPRLRMPARVDKVAIREGANPPKIGYIHVLEASTGTQLAADVTITDETGKALSKFWCMRFSEIEGTLGSSGGVQRLVHQLAWPPALLSETPLPLQHVIFVASEESTLLEMYLQQLSDRRIKTSLVSSPKALSDVASDISSTTVINFLPGQVDSIESISAASKTFCEQLLDVVKFVALSGRATRIFVITDGALAGATPTALAHAPLIGLGRIIASEHPDFWGALIDVDSPTFPFQAMKYVSGADIIKLEDTVAKVARLRPLPRGKILPFSKRERVQPRPEGTYIISGGLGALGLEVARFLVERGARRVVLLSRRTLPARKTWGVLTGSSAEVIRKIERLEQAGASVHAISVDLAATDAAEKLTETLDALSLPQVLGVVHAAGILEDQLVLEATADSFERVLSPKVAGTLTLHRMFAPGTLDFFVLFSSCGQLFGFPGQASYASGNAFLDSMAEHRRALGDNAVAFQWTSWQDMGMAASTDFIEAELKSKGITSVSRDEAFQAWDEVLKYDISHGVVLRTRVFDAEEPLPMSILGDIARRRAPDAGVSAHQPKGGEARAEMPKSGPELNAYLAGKISQCVASVLRLASVDDVDPKVALSDLGMDSVMTVAFRRQLQQTLKINVPPTLVWGHPTVSHLTKWFADKVKG